MKKKLLSSLLIGSLCLALGLPVTVYADGQKVVTLGADLSADQKTAVLKYFGILGQDVKTLTITNQDERDHLGSYVPLEQIGTHTYSCALVCPTNSGGIQVKTANLSWVTSNMIASTLSTSGVVNCDVLAASPFEVSGTGALTGIIMAYETASGVQLDPTRVDLANQELVATGTIANNIGQRQATNIVNEIKIEVIQGQVVDPNQVEEIVEEVVEENGLTVELSDEDRALLTGLMTQIAEQQYDYEEVRDTLQRVEDNVNDLSDQVDALQDSTELASDEEGDGAESETEETLESDSILLSTDDSALGENVIIDATNEEAVPDETEAEAETEDPFGFDIVTSDSYGDDGENAQEEAGGDDWTFDENENAGDAENIGDDWTFDENENTGDAENIGDDWTFDENGNAGDAENAGDDWSFDEGEGSDGGDSAVEEGTPVDDGTVSDPGVTDDGTVTDDGSAASSEGASLSLGQYCLAPDASSNGSQAAGISQFKLLLENTDLIPVSGTLTLTDSYGNICSTVDLADPEQAVAAAVSDADRRDSWTAGSKILINTGYALQPSESYVVTLDGVVASASDPSATASVSTSAQVNTESCGVVLNLSRATDAYPGATISGSVIMDEAATYAVLGSDDTSLVSFTNTEFTPEAADFDLNCLQAGTAEFWIEFYDADGNLLNTVSYELTILN